MACADKGAILRVGERKRGKMQKKGGKENMTKMGKEERWAVGGEKRELDKSGE